MTNFARGELPPGPALPPEFRAGPSTTLGTLSREFPTLDGEDIARLLTVGFPEDAISRGVHEAIRKRLIDQTTGLIVGMPGGGPPLISTPIEVDFSRFLGQLRASDAYYRRPDVVARMQGVLGVNLGGQGNREKRIGEALNSLLLILPDLQEAVNDVWELTSITGEPANLDDQPINVDDETWDNAVRHFDPDEGFYSRLFDIIEPLVEEVAQHPLATWMRWGIENIFSAIVRLAAVYGSEVTLEQRFPGFTEANLDPLVGDLYEYIRSEAQQIKDLPAANAEHPTMFMTMAAWPFPPWSAFSFVENQDILSAKSLPEIHRRIMMGSGLVDSLFALIDGGNVPVRPGPGGRPRFRPRELSPERQARMLRMVEQIMRAIVDPRMPLRELHKTVPLAVSSSNARFLNILAEAGKDGPRATERFFEQLSFSAETRAASIANIRTSVIRFIESSFAFPKGNVLRQVIVATIKRLNAQLGSRLKLTQSIPTIPEFPPAQETVESTLDVIASMREGAGVSDPLGSVPQGINNATTRALFARIQRLEQAIEAEATKGPGEPLSIPRVDLVTDEILRAVFPAGSKTSLISDRDLIQVVDRLSKVRIPLETYSSAWRNSIVNLNLRRFALGGRQPAATIKRFEKEAVADRVNKGANKVAEREATEVAETSTPAAAAESTQIREELQGTPPKSEARSRLENALKILRRNSRGRSPTAFSGADMIFVSAAIASFAVDNLTEEEFNAMLAADLPQALEPGEEVITPITVSPELTPANRIGPIIERLRAKGGFEKESSIKARLILGNIQSAIIDPATGSRAPRQNLERFRAAIQATFELANPRASLVEGKLSERDFATTLRAALGFAGRARIGSDAVRRILEAETRRVLEEPVETPQVNEPRADVVKQESARVEEQMAEGGGSPRDEGRFRTEQRSRSKNPETYLGSKMLGESSPYIAKLSETLGAVFRRSSSEREQTEVRLAKASAIKASLEAEIINRQIDVDAARQAKDAARQAGDAVREDVQARRERANQRALDKARDLLTISNRDIREAEQRLVFVQAFEKLPLVARLAVRAGNLVTLKAIRLFFTAQIRAFREATSTQERAFPAFAMQQGTEYFFGWGIGFMIAFFNFPAVVFKGLILGTSIGKRREIEDLIKAGDIEAAQKELAEMKDRAASFRAFNESALGTVVRIPSLSLFGLLIDAGIEDIESFVQNAEGTLIPNQLAFKARRLADQVRQVDFRLRDLELDKPVEIRSILRDLRAASDGVKEDGRVIIAPVLRVTPEDRRAIDDGTITVRRAIELLGEEDLIRSLQVPVPEEAPRPPEEIPVPPTPEEQSRLERQAIEEPELFFLRRRAARG
ncbi:MAG TPA: hypothetical protein VJ547_12140 [Candidatus Thermoplasmatota archaeon]|nr:hypothetical protein [Candidatus Thermoplasmatota archaeon]